MVKMVELKSALRWNGTTKLLTSAKHVRSFGAGKSSVEQGEKREKTYASGDVPFSTPYYLLELGEIGRKMSFYRRRQRRLSGVITIPVSLLLGIWENIFLFLYYSLLIFYLLISFHFYTIRSSLYKTLSFILLLN